MSRPTTLPEWNTSGANNVEPDAGRKSDGFDTGGDVPGSGELNWLFKKQYDWVSWFRDRELNSRVAQTLDFTKLDLSGAIGSVEQYGGACSPVDDHWVFVGQSDGSHAVISYSKYAMKVNTSGSWIKASHTTTGNRFLQAVTVGSSKFVAVGQDGKVSTCATNDPATWTARTSNTANTLQDIVWTGSQFLAIESAGGRHITSPDGVTWTLRTSNGIPATVALSRVAYHGGLYVVCGLDSSINLGKIYTSSDGLTFTLRYTGTDSANSIDNVLWSDSLNLWVAVTFQSAEYQTSTNGTSWTGRTFPGSSLRRGLISLEGAVIAFSVDSTLGDIPYMTKDGVNWTRVTAQSIPGPEEFNFHQAIVTNPTTGQLVYASSNGAGVFHMSHLAGAQP